MRALRWFATSLGGRYIHRSMHKVGEMRACWFCRNVWHVLEEHTKRTDPYWTRQG